MTPNITPQYFKDLFPEFATVPDARLNAYIGVASNRIAPGVWCNATQYATALLVAHMLSNSGPQGGGSAGGPLTSEQVDKLSRSYATVFQAGSGNSLLMTTRYGIELVQLRNENLVTATVAMLPPGGGWPC